MKDGEVETVRLLIMWITTCWPYGFADGRNGKFLYAEVGVTFTTWKTLYILSQHLSCYVNCGNLWKWWNWANCEKYAGKGEPFKYKGRLAITVLAFAAAGHSGIVRHSGCLLLMRGYEWLCACPRAMRPSAEEGKLLPKLFHLRTPAPLESTFHDHVCPGLIPCREEVGCAYLTNRERCGSLAYL